MPPTETAIMKHRPGITLVEVLVSLFIMGIGMIALLTLFPLGALNVAQALRDDRSAQAAANASACANAMGVRHLGAGQFVAQITGGFDPNGPSSPVYIDPYYVNIGAGLLGGRIHRVRPAAYITAPFAYSTDYWFSLRDDLNFEPDGTATVSVTGANPSVQRAGRYTWAYMLRRPRLGDESVVDMSTVVYADRSTQTVAGENFFAANRLSNTALTFNYTRASKPKLRNGSWILDVTQDAYPNYTVTPTGTYQVVRGYFYRVVDATENAANNTFTLELQTPLRAPPDPAPPPPGVLGVRFVPTAAYRIVVMENVIDVFERGTGYVP
jgi:hypothetical protein